MPPVLVVLRGNSGSGKTTTAFALREAALARAGDGPQPKIAVVEQDHLRRVVLKEHAVVDGDNIDLIHAVVGFSLDRGYAVILEGILGADQYGSMIRSLLGRASRSFLYYFALPFEETVRRHWTKPEANEFGPAQMRRWYRDRDPLGLAHEQLIGPDESQADVVDRILSETQLDISAARSVHVIR